MQDTHQPYEGQDTSAPSPLFNWRALLPVHPAADLFPLMTEGELKELAEDIKANGLKVPIVTWSSQADGLSLIDGRNRLDALALAGLIYTSPDGHIGLRKWNGKKWLARGERIIPENIHGGDPYALARSLNVLRRHLTLEQRREKISKALVEHPEKSDRQIADEVKESDHKKVGRVRRNAEATGALPQLKKTKGKDGKERPARRKTKSGAKPDLKPVASTPVKQAGDVPYGDPKVSSEKLKDTFGKLYAEDGAALPASDPAQPAVDENTSPQDAKPGPAVEDTAPANEDSAPGDTEERRERPGDAEEHAGEPGEEKATELSAKFLAEFLAACDAYLPGITVKDDREKAFHHVFVWIDPAAAAEMEAA
jgi:hypothetical protein